ncbi:MAG: biotin--[Oscillospiraceae bacterium]|nr:biotin--[acetyl-CoA-carboxylase] ligase [Oscillospiraceae bacterium]
MKNPDEYPISRAWTDSLRRTVSDIPELRQLLVFDCVDSTNTLLRTLGDSGAEEGTVVIARQQTAGRGRQGRSFYSPPDTGIYLSALFKPQRDILALTPMAAAAAAEAVEALSGEQVQIKWVNDLLLRRKKICGILCESRFTENCGIPDYAIVGIGINLMPPPDGFPPEIQDIAGTVFPSYAAPEERFMRCAELLTRRIFAQYRGLGQKAYLESYRARLSSLYKEILVLENGETRKAYALAVDDDLRLLVRYEDGQEEWRSTGEIRIREDIHDSFSAEYRQHQ